MDDKTTDKILNDLETDWLTTDFLLVICIEFKANIARLTMKYLSKHFLSYKNIMYNIQDKSIDIHTYIFNSTKAKLCIINSNGKLIVLKDIFFLGI